MAKLIGTIIGVMINVVIILPFIILRGIFSGISRASNIEKNAENGREIEALCMEMGVPSVAYNRIVFNRMDEAKNIALQIGQLGHAHHDSPWNTRLAIAISTIYKDASQTDNISSSETALSQLNKLTIQIYRSYAEQNGIAPTEKTSDTEMHEIIRLVQSNFTDAARQKGERIPATYLMTITVKFFQVYETVGKEFFSKHLEYEVNKYISEGLRDDYKKDLGMI